MNDEKPAANWNIHGANNWKSLDFGSPPESTLDAQQPLWVAMSSSTRDSVPVESAIATFSPEKENSKNLTKMSEAGGQWG